MLATLLLAPILGAPPAVTYPESRRDGTVETIHGTEVQDPYRWLEGDVREAPEVSDWVDVQNEVTFAKLHAIPAREMIRPRLEQLWDYARTGTPSKVGGRYYFTHNNGLQNQAAWIP